MILLEFTFGTDLDEAADTDAALPLVVVDGANVVGSVPDGWWRDRLGAARRLRDALGPVAAAGLADVPGPVEVVLVVEGGARRLADEPGPGTVRVIAAPGSGDDTIVDLVAAARRRCVVVSSDRGLRDRVVPLGAAVVGPRALPYPSAPGSAPSVS
jgi:hypothetical protein